MKADGEKPFRNICGVGASAGGLEALQEFLGSLPDDHLFSIVVVQHLSPTHESKLVDLLSRRSRWPVREAEHGIVPENGFVYITPPASEIYLEAGALQLKQPPRDHNPKPSIDRFFESLAAASGPQSSAVILSGTGRDGSHGVGAIVKAGGFCMAQDPRQARYSGMPAAAIDTGLLHASGSARDLADFVYQLYRNRDWRPPEQPAVEPGPADEILEILAGRYKTDFSNYKRPTIHRRIQKAMREKGIPALAEYAAHLRENAAEQEELFYSILIGVTEFFRDPSAFEALRPVLEKLVEVRPEGTLRIWCVGCSTGEEAYSLAVLLLELIAQSGRNTRLQIFATDIDEYAVAAARAGIYQAAQLKNLPADLLSKYFSLSRAGYEVKKHVRECILFSRHDVTANPPFLKIDLISCRNLLIYFNQELQKRIHSLFHYALSPGGILFLGRSESVGDASRYFAPLDARAKIYQRIRSAELESLPPFRSQRTAARKQEAPPEKPESVLQRARAGAFQNFSHPFVVLNQQDQVIEVSGDISDFARLTEGPVTLSLTRLLDNQLQLEARRILSALKRGEAVTSGHVLSVQRQGHPSLLRLHGRLMDDPDSHEKLMVLTFESLPGQAPGRTENRESDGQAALEAELAMTRQNMQTLIEELETSNEELQSLNEELQSTNEELQSTNEELETSNEELQAANEEVNTAYVEVQHVNEELRRNEESLKAAEANLRALLNNKLQINILIDANLTIIDFNEKAADLAVFGSRNMLAPGSTLLDHIPEDLVEQLYRDIKECLGDGGVNTEYRFALPDGNSRIYRANLTPLAAHRGTILSLSLLDVTRERETESQLREALRENQELQSLLDSYSIVSHSDIHGNITYINDNFLEMTGYTRAEVIGKNFRLFKSGEHSQEFYDNLWKTVSSGKTWRGVLTNKKKDGELYNVDAMIAPVFDEKGEIKKYVTVRRDITRLKEVEHELQQKNLFFRALINAIPDSFVVLNAEGTILFVNDSWNEFARMNDGRLARTGIGNNYLTVCEKAAAAGADEAADFLREFAKLAGGEARTFTIEYPCHSPGEQRWFRCRCHRTHEAGETLYLVVHENITQRKIEEAVRERNNALFETITNGARIGIMIADFDGRIIEYNNALREILGFPEGSTIDWKAITPPEYVAQDEEIAARFRKEGSVRLFLKEYWRKDGTRVPVALGGKVIDGAPGQVLCYVIDLSDKKELEIQFTEAQKKFAAVSESMRNLLLICDSDLTVTYANTALRLEFGADPLGMKAQDVVPPGTALVDEMALALMRGTVRSLELEWKGPDGRNRWYIADIATIDSGRGKPSVFALLYNATELKMREIDLRAARDEAESAMKSRTEFISMISHELRNPMSAVLGVTDLLENSSLDERQRRYAGMIRSQGESLMRIIDDVLDFGRISAGTMQTEDRPVQLRPLLAEIDAVFGPRVRGKGLAWDVDMQDIPELMLTDPVRLKQILSNLLNNAVKFTAKGSITLRVRANSSNPEQVVFAVADTGIGIKGEHTGRLFNAFSQATEDIARRFGGTGLGLAISQQLAKMMGGEISLESSYGVGSTFTLTLPVRELQPGISRKESQAASSFTGRALIVDDNSVNLTVLAALLGQLGIAVDAAESGAAALEKLGQTRYDVVLTDLELGDMSGFDLLRGAPAGMYYVAVSAHPQLEKKPECIRAGFADYIEKPVRLQTLSEVLARLFSSRQ